ncbi:MAG TPA: hypothetical protein VHE35_23870, partial [Kofleriaceae bacterium]|nr:hypothetical protein [Kofleriaceae bacterium]
MRRLLAVVIVIASAGAAGCGPNSAGGTCDPRNDDCTCNVNVTCVDGFHCDHASGTCEADVDAGGPVDAGIDAPIDAQLAGFGEPCLDKHECTSGICIFVGSGGRCSDLCNGDDCPPDWGCFGVVGAIEPGHVDDVCVPVSDQLCSPCATDDECTQIGVDKCLAYPDGTHFCGRDCRMVDCPSGYACTDMTIGGMQTKQCVPQSGACDCDASNTGMTQACTIMTPFNTACAGNRTCGGATGWGSCAPPSMMDSPDGTYADSNCDGIDGDVTRGIFVAGGGANLPSCGLTAQTPCQTISYGIVRAVTVGRNQVYVQAGTYNETIVMLNGVSVWGGYDFGWQRGPISDPAHRTIVVGQQDTTTAGDGEYLTVRAHDLIVPVTMGDLVLRGPMATGTTGGNGHSSYVIHARAATVNLERVELQAGNGADGAAGGNGSDAPIVDATGGMFGQRGGDGQQFGPTCNSSDRGGGGARGTNSCVGGPSGRPANGGGGGAGGTLDSDCGVVSRNLNARGGDGGGNADFTNGAFGAAGSGGSGSDSCGPTTSGGSGFVANGGAGGRHDGAAIVNG